jgi:hypothetical protein
LKLKRISFSIDLKREKNWKGKKCVACSKWKVVKKEKSKMSTPSHVWR